MKKTFIFAIALLTAAWAVSAQDIPPQAPAPQNPQENQDAKYTNESIGRLSFVEGKAFVQRASDLGFEEGALNMPITEGDRIATSDGRAEVHFGRGNYLRLDADTKLDILNLPKKEDDVARIRVWSGNVYLVVGTLRKEKAIELHTADASFYVLDRGVFRIDVRENSDTEIQVFQGLIEAAGEQGSTLLKGSQRLEITEGRFASKPSTFIAVADNSFDRFNESRTSVTGREFAQGRLPGELSDYEGELEEYGEWTYLAPYGNVWIPYDVNDDWRPYYNGRWTWLPLSGWTWWPYEPWGWATFHYGRWHWGLDLGWYWIPMNIWGPAWVNWWWNDYYFGWAPLSYWGYPGVYMGGMYYGRYYGQYYPYASRALTVVRRENLKDPHIAANALRGDSLKSLNRITMTNSTLDVRPAGTRISVQPLDGSRVLLRNDGAARLERGSRTTDRVAGGPGGARVIRKPGGQAGTQGAATGAAAKPRAVRSPDRGDKASGAAKKSSSSGRNIRKKDGEPAAAAMSAGYRSDPNIAGTTARVGQATRTVYGYPSSPSVRGPLSYGDGGGGRARTYSGPFTRPSYGGSIARPSTGRSSVPTVRSGSSRGRTASAGRSSVGSARGGSSRGSASRGSASRGSSSASRGSSGGSVRRK